MFDSGAVPATSGEPAFLSRPVGAPVYYGFPVIEGAEAGTLVLADTAFGALSRTSFGADEKRWGR